MLSHTESVVKKKCAGNVECHVFSVPVHVFHTAHLPSFHPHSVTNPFNCIMASVFINSILNVSCESILTALFLAEYVS